MTPAAALEGDDGLWAEHAAHQPRKGSRLAPRRAWRRAVPGLVLLVSTLAVGAADDESEPPMRLQDCQRPSCVSSQASDPARRVAPLRVDGAMPAFQAALQRALEDMPRTRFVEQRPDYWHLECRSLVFRFVDDLEFLFDAEAGVVHVRSASRIGYSDFGVNRRRVERIRERLAASR